MYKSRLNLLAVAVLACALPLGGCATDSMFADETITPYGGSKQHPIKVANGKATVEGCGEWSENLADSEDNTMAANHGCAVQSNIAAMAAYPSDLIGNKRRLPKPLGFVHQYAIDKVIAKPDTQGGATGGSGGAGSGTPGGASGG
jgi:pilus assembly protein CpaD